MTIVYILSYLAVFFLGVITTGAVLAFFVNRDVKKTKKALAVTPTPDTCTRYHLDADPLESSLTTSE